MPRIKCTGSPFLKAVSNQQYILSFRLHIYGCQGFVTSGRSFDLRLNIRSSSSLAVLVNLSSKHFVLNFCKFSHLCTEPNFDGGILWCYDEKNAVPSQQFASGKRIKFHEGVHENFTNSGSMPSLIILDDLLIEVYSQELCHLFAKGSHNRNISVILITQNLFHQVR
jgi:hypothetical protein